MHIIRAKDQKTAQWAGGSTTEIAIFPPKSAYSSRDFLWRVSTATVEQPSDFTLLHGFTRHLMVLQGAIKLSIAGSATCIGELEQICFGGGEPVRSEGNCRDFNLMLATGYCGSLRVAAKSGNAQADFIGLYSLFDEACLDICGKTATLNSGDFLLARHELSYSVLTENATLIFVEITKACVPQPNEKNHAAKPSQSLAGLSTQSKTALVFSGTAALMAII